MQNQIVSHIVEIVEIIIDTTLTYRELHWVRYIKIDPTYDTGTGLHHGLLLAMGSCATHRK